MMKKIKVAIPGWPWKPENFYLIRILAQKYDIEFSKKPDLFFLLDDWDVPKDRSITGVNCLRVFNTIENVKPDFTLCDYAFSFRNTDDRNFQISNFSQFPEFEGFRTQRYSDRVKEYRDFTKTEFCNFLQSILVQPRTAFAQKLMAYKRVDCPGKVLNNTPMIGKDPKAKLEFIKRYKFTIAFENQSSPNYVTEKIYHALLVNSIPIYWGSPKIAEFFNPEAFINCHDYDSFDHVIDRIIAVDNDEELYRKYADAPPVLEGSRLHAFSEERIMERLDKIVDSIGVVRPVYTPRRHQQHMAVTQVKATLRPLKSGLLGLLKPVKMKIDGRLGLDRGLR